MRKKIIAGNWKMNKTLSDAQSLLIALNEELKTVVLPPDVDVYICPPFPYLEKLQQTLRLLDNTTLKVGAQNCHYEDWGAFTGEVSAAMLKSLDIQRVIIGHSERRQYFNETDEVVKAKTQAALNHQLQVIFCCGENLEQREANKHFQVVAAQLQNALFHLSSEQFAHIIIAYEPVWAIGTGKTATPEQAQEMHTYIRQLLAEKYGTILADETTILYGGSCNAANAHELFANADVDGGLIGGASLKTTDFVAIIKAIAA